MLSQPKIICIGGRFCRILSAQSVQIRWKRFGIFYGTVRRLWMFGKSVIGRFPSPSLVKSDGLGWVQQLMAKLDSNVLLEALSVARCIWLRRNGAVFRQGFADPRQIVTQGREVVCFFVEARQTASPTWGSQILWFLNQNG
jgi:hypothetical protein